MSMCELLRMHVCMHACTRTDALGEKTGSDIRQTDSKRKRGRRCEGKALACTFMIFTGLCACEDTLKKREKRSMRGCARL